MRGEFEAVKKGGFQISGTYEIRIKRIYEWGRGGIFGLGNLEVEIFRVRVG